MPRYRWKNFGEYWEHLNLRERPLLARLAGISYQSLHNIATGRRKAGHITMAKLAKVDVRLTPRLMRPDLYGKRAYMTDRSWKTHGLPELKPSIIRQLNKKRGQGSWNKGGTSWNKGKRYRLIKPKKVEGGA